MLDAGVSFSVGCGGSTRGAVGDHLKVDLGLIRATGEGLKRIRGALRHAEVDNPGAGVFGPGKLSEAMGEFVDNWKIHRGRLLAAVEAHEKMAIDSANAYEHTDTELAKDLTAHSSPGGGRAAR